MTNLEFPKPDQAAVQVPGEVLVDEVFRTAMEVSSIGMCIVGPTGRFVQVNPALCTLFGRDAEALMASTWQELTHPDDLHLDQCLVDSVLSGERESYRLTKRYLRPDGEVVWGDLSVSCLRDEYGSVRFFVSQIVDVTAERREREARLATERLYRLLAENASDVVVHADPNGVIQWVSSSVEELLGWSSKELVGRSLIDLVHPDDRSEADGVQSAVPPGESLSVEIRLATADGGYRWVAAGERVVADDAGSVTEWVVRWRDIEFERIARAALVAAEQHYRLLAENASDLVLLTDRNQIITWVSPNTDSLLGWRVEELLNTPVTALMKPEQVAEIVRNRNSFYDRGSSDEARDPYLFELLTKPGRYRWFSGRVLPVRDDAGHHIAMVAGLSDVTELVEARRRAEAEEALHKALVDSLLDPHVLLLAVRDEANRIFDFSYADANQAACDYLSMSRADLVGARLLDVLPGHANTGMVSLCAYAVEHNEPLILDDFPHTLTDAAAQRRYDIRGVSTGDALAFTWRDVTDRHEAMRRLAESEEQYRLLAENSSDVVLHAKNAEIVWVSPSLQATLGWLPSEWIGTSIFDYFPVEDHPRIRVEGARIAAGERLTSRFRIKGKDLRLHWIDASAHSYINAAGEVDGVASSFSLADAAVEAEAALRESARRDGLTGMLNRAAVFDELDQLSQQQPRTGHEVAVVFCDMDDFKEINDTHGHSMGDFVLQTAASQIRATLREDDLVARLGGDEILLVLNGVQDLDSAVAVANKVRVRVSRRHRYQGIEYTLKMSIGVTLLRRGEAVDEVIDRADVAMYQAKKRGGDCVVAVR